MSQKQDFNELVQEALRRSSVDSDFRELMLSDPEGALKQISVSPLPEGVGFKFVDNSGVTTTIPLPDPVPGLQEVSGEELAAAAGGSTSWSNITSWKLGS